MSETPAMRLCFQGLLQTKGIHVEAPGHQGPRVPPHRQSTIGESQPERAVSVLTYYMWLFSFFCRWTPLFFQSARTWPGYCPSLYGKHMHHTICYRLRQRLFNHHEANCLRGLDVGGGEQLWNLQMIFMEWVGLDVKEIIRWGRGRVERVWSKTTTVALVNSQIRDKKK